MEEVVYVVSDDETEAVRVEDEALLEFVPRRKPSCDECIIRTHTPSQWDYPALLVQGKTRSREYGG